MVDPNLVSGFVWVLCGLAILGLGSLIAFRGRVDLHANYDESVDPAYVSRWAGGTALLMGVLVVAYGIREMRAGFDPRFLAGLIVALLVLRYLSNLFAGGFGARE
ncbi:hypothetical protein [Natrinema versiforme]|uniref:DUF3784 domain-containing protein n=1 Tax=Natrinema versiforme JCM 10478 TaxID=1227496 RepID=L9YBV3_9EURY|nr:hypothetical protein [Natrinema versiforme]ELY70403.1 hypothetical protein C489_02386 [Natrinema versiforme JCM 10478]